MKQQRDVLDFDYEEVKATAEQELGLNDAASNTDIQLDLLSHAFDRFVRLGTDTAKGKLYLAIMNYQMAKTHECNLLSRVFACQDNFDD
jgi:hypothetical protein